MRIIIPGTPVAKARARVTRDGYAYTPSRTAEYEKHVAERAQLAMITGRRKMTGAPVKVEMALVFPIPPSWPKKRRAAALMGSIHHTVKPDAENVSKAILDAMSGVIYADDKQVIDLRVTKHYGPEPKAIVEVTEIAPSVAVEIAA